MAETEPQAEPGAEDGGDDWRDGISDEKQRKYAENFSTPADAVKAALEFRQKLSNAVVRPGRNASEDETAAFRRALGVPETPEGYAAALSPGVSSELHLDDAGRARMNDYFKAMHDVGAPPAAVQAGIDAYFGMVREATDAQARTSREVREKAEAELTREWGNDFPGNLETARRAAREFGGERFLAFVESAKVDGMQLGNHPEFLRAFAAAGRRMGEDVLHAGLGGGGGGHHDAQARIDELTALQTGEPQKYRSREVQDELRTLYASLHGDAPIVGSGGRNT